MNEFLAGGVLGTILGYLVKTFIDHSLAKSRDQQSFEREASAKRDEESRRIAAELGAFANSIVTGWEAAEVISLLSRPESRDTWARPPDLITFKNFDEARSPLVSLGIFPPNVWHFYFDRLPKVAERINTRIRDNHIGGVFSLCYHFAEMCDNCYSLVVAEYVEHGGDLKGITSKPFPIKIDK